jgi:TRAP-type C4-dicarboxylate transport system permease large subunit
MSNAVKGVSPFVAAYAVLLGLFILFPQLITIPADILGGSAR